MGYVFNEDLQNAFVDVSDNIYSNLAVQLFNNQSSFVNIKIQFGTQSIRNGQLITNSKVITINTMNVLSKSGCQLTVMNGQLNIITQLNSNQTQINDLMINLSFQMSLGNITLINQISGQMILQNYQILGTYLSQGCIALLSLNTYQANITATNINIIPYQFNSGNISSYLLSYVVQCSISLNSISIIIGNISQTSILNQISTNNASQLQFGGIVQYLTTTSIKLLAIIVECYQQLNSQYIRQSGLLIGKSQYINDISISNLCVLQIIQGYNTKFIDYLGVVGLAEGIIKIQQSSVTFNYNATNFNGIGNIIGYTTANCTKSEIINLISTINVIINLNLANNYGAISALIGDQYSFKCSFSNTIVKNCNISCLTFCGGMIGHQFNSTVILESSIVYNCNISSNQKGSGGVFGYSNNANIIINNLTLQFIHLTCPNNLGMILGYQLSPTSNTLVATNSISKGANYVNFVQISNCVDLMNAQTITGC
ncbi:Hypothetical_protein [Hexamita inflata]|uniref:Hypothetical_protein n=1 Tax=Hexamita inflata TaxID=28002 RepID=A0AA86TJ25_9EUKA|nr:Hypothetical protein HINF_LOCUS6645 [Hexamita inflata]